MHGPTELYSTERFNLARKVANADAVVCISEYTRSQLMYLSEPESWGKLQRGALWRRPGALPVCDAKARGEPVGALRLPLGAGKRARRAYEGDRRPLRAWERRSGS